MSHHFTTDIYFPLNCFSSLGRWFIGVFWLVKYSEKGDGLFKVMLVHLPNDSLRAVELKGLVL